MKKLFFFSIALLFSFFAQSQTVPFHENFELPSLADSVVSSGSPGFAINTNFHNSGLRCDSSKIATGATSALTTNAFSTIGNTFIILEFSHIAKTEFLDGCIIQVSNDNGATWTQCTSVHYLGTSNFAAQGNKFCSASYTDWLPGVPGAIPTDSWWRTEQFDISVLASNAANVKVRFQMADGNGNGANGNYGWLIDDIKVTIAASELNPPVITYVNPIFLSTVYNLGPFNVRAKITDASGIDTAIVYYKVNNGSLLSVPMIMQSLDTFMGTIPAVLDGDSVHYYVYAEDLSPNHNNAVNPVAGFRSFLASTGVHFPYVDNFDIVNNLWTPSGAFPGTQWQLGTPAYSLTTGAHSSPNAWDVNLATTYGTSSTCTLTSPVFDFSSTVNAKMTFWVNFDTYLYGDGVRLEYTTNGTTWQVLGSVGDPNAINWYNIASIYSSSLPAWSGSSGGWFKTEYILTQLNSVVGPVQFRFIFSSYVYSGYSGFSIDDFSIIPPSPQEATALLITAPAGGCGLSNEIVKMKIKNTGSANINGNLTASYKVVGGSTIAPENVTGVILPGDTLLYTFSTPVNLSVTVDSTFKLIAWVNLLGDPVQYNDTTGSFSVLSKYAPSPPVVTNATIPYATSTTLSPISLDTLLWYATPTGGTPIDTGHTFTTPVLYDTAVYYVSASSGEAAGFYISGLLTTGSYVIDQNTYAGDDRGGIAITESYYYYMGDNNAVRFDMPGLTNPVSYNKRDGIFSDLAGSGTLYTLWNGTADPVGTSITSYIVNSVRTLNADLSLGSTIIPLSQNITVGGGNTPAIFSGLGFLILYNGTGGIPANTFYKVELPSGQVTVLGTYSFTAAYCENWARWGIAEFNNNDYSVVYVTGSTNISRLNLTTGVVSTVGTYSNLSDMACITFSPWTNRWYFHHEYNGQFGGADETAGYADAVATVTGGGCPSTRVADTVFVTGIPALDAGAQIIYHPVTGVNLTNAEPVQIRIKNYGTSAINNFQVGYQLNSLTPILETVSATINPGDTLIYTFTQNANLYNFGFYDIKAWTDLTGDYTAINDTAYKTVENKMPVYCTSAATYTGYEDIGNVTLSNLNNGNPLPVLSNPTAINTYSDFTALTPAMLSPGNSYPISISMISPYTYIYNSWVNVWIDYNRDGVYDPVTELAFGGQLTSSLTTITGTVNVPVTASLGVTQMRVVLVEGGTSLSVVPCGAYSYGETEDYRVAIAPAIPHDAGVTYIVSPHATDLAGTPIPVIVTFKNFGTDTIHALDLAYEFNGGAAVVTPWTGHLSPNNSVNDTLPSVTLLGTTNNLCAYTILVDDTNTFNDQTCIISQGIPFDTLSYVTDFDGSVTDWYQVSTAGSTWQWGTPAFGSTNTAHSTPKAWDINLTSAYTNSALSYLYSPMFQFTGAYGVKLSFWRNLYLESCCDGLQLQYSTNGTTWQALGTVADPNATNWYTTTIGVLGAVWTGGPTGWVLSEYTLVPLNGFVGAVQFRFAFGTDGSVIYDGVSIDDFSIIQPSPIDGGVVSFVSPSSPAFAGNSVPVTISVRNFGTDTLLTIPVKYTVNGGSPVIDTLHATIPPGGLSTFTFPGQMTVPTGNFEICAYTDLPPDGLRANDTTCNTIFGEPPAISYYSDDFEGSTTQCYAPVGSHWQWGVPNSSVINFPHSPTKCWKTSLTGNYVNNALDYLYTPKFNFAGMSNVTLRFWHWIQTAAGNDGCNIQYSINGGSTWVTLGYYGTPIPDPNAMNWYDHFVNGKHCWQGAYSGWMYSQYRLTASTFYTAPTVQFRFQLFSDASGVANGWAVDDIVVTVDQQAKDVGVTVINAPLSPTYQGASNQVNVKIKNFGLDTLTFVPLFYKVNAGPAVSGTWNGTLYPDSTSNYSFASQYSTPVSAYTLYSYSVLTGDPHKFNDTTHTHFAPVLAPLDAGVKSIISPSLITLTGTVDTVKIKIKNYGADTLSSVPVAYRINSNPLVNETYNGTLHPGDSVVYTFTTTYPCPTSAYTLCAYTKLVGDMVPSNDSICTNITVGIDELYGNGFYLEQNIPNPTAANTIINYAIPAEGTIRFDLVNVLGQNLYTLTRKDMAGVHQIDLKVGNLPSGIYYYSLRFGAKTLVKKMVIEK